MEKRTPAAIVLVVAIVTIGCLYALALSKGIDGVLLMPVVAVIALLAGTKVTDLFDHFNGRRR